MRDVLSIIKDAKSVIDRLGFAVLSAQESPGYTHHENAVYTVGLAGMGLPELVLFGMTPDIAAGIITHLAKLQVEQGPFTHGRVIGKEVFKEGTPYTLIMAEVEEDKIDVFFQVDRVFYGPDLKITAMQVCWPDASGKFPWEEGSTLGNQTRLGRKPL